MNKGQDLILTKNLETFLVAMEGACFPKMTKSTEGMAPIKDEESTGYFDGERFYFQDYEEIINVYKHFMMLLMNRRRHMDQQRSSSRTKE